MEALECRKCQGLMITEWLADELDEAFVWRCVNWERFWIRLSSTITDKPW